MGLDKKGIQVLILILIAVLVGLAFATSIADNIYEQSNTFTKTNESIYINSTRLGAQPNVNQSMALSLANPKLSSTTIVLSNSSDGSVIDTGNYTVNLTGTSGGYDTYSIYLINGSQWGIGKYNLTYATSSYYPESYVPYSNARTILGLITIFMALMVLLVVIDYVTDGGLRDLIRR
jgi:hypothetical protein